MSLYSTLRPLLFRLDPERAHGLVITALRLAQALPGAPSLLARRFLVADPALRQTLLGLEFPNPLGLAAGFDKDGVVVDAMAALGFGFVEVGTVTPRPQAGNPRPRLFRYPGQRSLQNALGFNNQGLQATRRRLARARRLAGSARAASPVGVNVGKGRDTPPERALADYEELLGDDAGLGGLADYLVVNLSSPNTPGLRDLQNETFLKELLRAARALTRTPVLVKLSPDLEPEAAAGLAAVAVDAGAAGIVATNTSTDYALLPGARAAGGLSGQVLREKSRRVCLAIARRLRAADSGAVLISAGGIDSGAEAYARIRAGASLVQLYTALIYEGPSLPRRINRELLALLARDGCSDIGQAVGADL
ncbi:MAG TPA: quinone-dependent dihydroorotate dehydrogenase [Thermoanaerobaculia bacterium]|nr:quinone-dependent dihydroorotate dehydrogenase [Thermoanaerobaculia bacterium]